MKYHFLNLPIYTQTSDLSHHYLSRKIDFVNPQYNGKRSITYHDKKVEPFIYSDCSCIPSNNLSPLVQKMVISLNRTFILILVFNFLIYSDVGIESYYCNIYIRGCTIENKQLKIIKTASGFSLKNRNIYLNYDTFYPFILNSVYFCIEIMNNDRNWKFMESLQNILASPPKYNLEIASNDFVPIKLSFELETKNDFIICISILSATLDFSGSDLPHFEYSIFFKIV